jgi:hypothetical protein
MYSLREKQYIINIGFNVHHTSGATLFLQSASNFFLISFSLNMYEDSKLMQFQQEFLQRPTIFKNCRQDGLGHRAHDFGVPDGDRGNGGHHVYLVRRDYLSHNEGESPWMKKNK